MNQEPFGFNAHTPIDLERGGRAYRFRYFSKNAGLPGKNTDAGCSSPRTRNF